MAGRLRFLSALGAAALSALACIATLIEPQWFELLFDSAPDQGDGTLETIIAVGISAVACILFSALARREWVRGRAASAAESAQALAPR